jgi:hypothetical protein
MVINAIMKHRPRSRVRMRVFGRQSFVKPSQGPEESGSEVEKYVVRVKGKCWEK